jgi:glutamine synthetase
LAVRSQTPPSYAAAELQRLRERLEHAGWDVHSFDHEDGNAQYEFDFSYTDAIWMADRFMLFRMMAKEVAPSRGYEATFMPKPWSDKTGGGAHFNMSLASAVTARVRLLWTQQPHPHAARPDEVASRRVACG